ncbi:183_t:CDS:1, partial [Acaulospora morrowiae]
DPREKERRIKTKKNGLYALREMKEKRYGRCVVVLILIIKHDWRYQVPP